MRLYAGLLQAATLPSVGAQVAAFDVLKPGATAEESLGVDCVIAMTRDDWASALGHSCGDPSLAGYELRALGELGRVEEMIAALARLQPKPHRRELDHYRLTMLAFTGRVDCVRALLRGCGSCGRNGRPIGGSSPRTQPASRTDRATRSRTKLM